MHSAEPLEIIACHRGLEGERLRQRLRRHFLGIHAREKKGPFLERAWTATQAVLALSDVKAEPKEEAVRRAVELAPKVKEELAQFGEATVLKP